MVGRGLEAWRVRRSRIAAAAREAARAGGSHFSDNFGTSLQYNVRVKLLLKWDPPERLLAPAGGGGGKQLARAARRRRKPKENRQARVGEGVSYYIRKI